MMKPFGWIQPPQIAPTELITGVCLWLAAGMALSLGAAWWVLDVMPVRAFTAHGWLIAVLTILWFACGLTLNLFFARFGTRLAFCCLCVMSLLTGLLFASIFTLSSLALAFAVVGGMFLTSAALAHFTGAMLRGGGYCFVMVLIGLGLSALVNSLLHSSVWLWIGSMSLVLLFSLTTAYQTPRITGSARELYHRNFTTVQCCAIRGALAVYLGMSVALFEILRLLAEILTALSPGSGGSSR
ncbi:Bax inhibitor-1 family protein [Kosakonia oryzendophytica]|uniref:Bax inhibitor-1 family protein n=1 Tax=Kosakonia oryzendophytica TaxID=1005665 RepID=UPI003D331AE4